MSVFRYKTSPEDFLNPPDPAIHRRAFFTLVPKSLALRDETYRLL